MRCTTLHICDKVCRWLATCLWFSLGPRVSSTNKTDHHNISWNIVESGIKDHQTNLLYYVELTSFGRPPAIKRPHQGSKRSGLSRWLSGIVLSGLLPFTDSDYPFGIFKLFLLFYKTTEFLRYILFYFISRSLWFNK